MFIRNNRKYIFQKENSPITIGRDRSCDIFFINDKSFSRIQTTIDYDENLDQWSVRDGKSKSSTNGTWVYAAHSIEINDGAIFRLGNSKIKASLKY
jgi:pSer/pThr/pTyr-binding forkhead associated (FHA) protein